MVPPAVGPPLTVGPWTVSVSGFTTPFMTWGRPSGDGTQHTSMYVPGSSVIVPLAVCPAPTLFGPPTSVTQSGILSAEPQAFIALRKSADVFPRSSLTTQRWCTPVPAFFMRKVIVPAGTDAGDLKW